MRLNHLFVTAVAALGLQSLGLAQVQPVVAPSGDARSEVSMCVTTGIGTCGDFCQPFECTPNYTLVSSYEDMIFDVAGAPGTFYALFYGLAVPGCLPVPGIEGALATWYPTSTVAFGFFEEVSNRPDLICRPGTATLPLHIPLVPPGVDIRFQLLGLNVNQRDHETLSFSRATEVRTR